MAIDIMIGFSMMVVIVTGGPQSLRRRHRRLRGDGDRLAARARSACRLPLAIVGALALGGALGAVNGALIVRSGLHSFIITLATMSIFFGVMVFLTRAEAFRSLPPEIAAFGKMRIVRLRLAAADCQHRRRLGPDRRSTA